MLKRNANSAILQWLSQSTDALLVTGARQIGKTYSIRECLKESGRPFVEFNLIEQPELIDLFRSAETAADLTLRISAAAGRTLIPNETVIFIDEVQEYHEIVTQMKFLVKDSPFRYILSGSLLGVELNDLRSAPVGYLQTLDMYPMSLEEFFTAIGLSDTVLEHIRTCFSSHKPVDEYIHKKMIDAFYLYLIIGGMPEAVQTYIDTNDIAKVNEIHEKIRRQYQIDFTKYEQNSKLRLRDLYAQSQVNWNQRTNALH